jgi:hypothetical protein
MGSAGLPAVRSRRHNFRCAACALLPSLCRLHTKKTQHCGRRGRVGVAHRADDRRHVVSALISRFATCTAYSQWLDGEREPAPASPSSLSRMDDNGWAAACSTAFGAEPGGAPATRAPCERPAGLACLLQEDASAQHGTSTATEMKRETNYWYQAFIVRGTCGRQRERTKPAALPSVADVRKCM